MQSTSRSGVGWKIRNQKLQIDSNSLRTGLLILIGHGYHDVRVCRRRRTFPGEPARRVDEPQSHGERLEGLTFVLLRLAVFVRMSSSGLWWGWC